MCRIGALDGGFFQALVAERPLRFQEISELAKLWGASVQPPAEKPPDLEPGPKKGPLFSLEILFRGRKIYFAILGLFLASGVVWLMPEPETGHVEKHQPEKHQPREIRSGAILAEPPEERLRAIARRCAESLNVSTRKFTVEVREVEGRWDIAFFDSHHSAIDPAWLGFDPSLRDKLKMCISRKLQDMPPVEGVRSGEVSLKEFSLEEELEQRMRKTSP